MTPLHLIVDEADLLAPQRLPKDMLRLLGAMDDVVRRGRAHGLSVTLITQRPAVLNKDVLGQAEVLIALRMTSPRDVAAIDEWIRLHADEATELRRSLPSLVTPPVGVVGAKRRRPASRRWNQAAVARIFARLPGIR